MAGTHNPLLPEMATVIETVQETHNIKTFRVRFDDEEKMKNFTFQPGQVGQLSVFGVGIVQRIETLSTDHKLVVAFDNAGEKTLLAKFAKLTKL